MKILLIYPNFLDERLSSYDVSVMPIGLYYIGAYLKANNYDVELLNWYDVNKTPHKIEDTFREKKPDIIGFSIMNANRWGGIDIANIAKRILPNAKIIFGGIGATFLWRHLLTHFKSIDYIIIGEGERSFLDLIKCIEDESYNKVREINPKNAIRFLYGRHKYPQILCIQQDYLYAKLQFA